MGLLMMNLRYPFGECPWGVEVADVCFVFFVLGCSDGLRPNFLDWRESFGIESLSIC